jgi:hypothetical protein
MTLLPTSDGVQTADGATTRRREDDHLCSDCELIAAGNGYRSIL